MNLNTASGCSANTELIDSLHVHTTAKILMFFQVDSSSYFLPTLEILTRRKMSGEVFWRRITLRLLLRHSHARLALTINEP